MEFPKLIEQMIPMYRKCDIIPEPVKMSPIKDQFGYSAGDPESPMADHKWDRWTEVETKERTGFKCPNCEDGWMQEDGLFVFDATHYYCPECNHHWTMYHMRGLEDRVNDPESRVVKYDEEVIRRKIKPEYQKEWDEACKSKLPRFLSADYDGDNIKTFFKRGESE